MKIYDCFTFFNEIELLNFRLDYLCDTVDYFVITEGRKTFSGKEKNQNFSLDIIKNEQVKNKIRYFYIDFTDEAYINTPIYQELASETECWQREEYQRDCLSMGLFDADKEDMILITDIDEIPNKDMLNQIKIEHQVLDLNSVLSIEMDHFYGSIFNKTQHWYHPKVMKFKSMQDRFSFIRLGISTNFIRSGGWHFTSFGGKDRVLTKLNSFSHTSAANEKSIKKILDETNIENHDKNLYHIQSLPDLIFSDRYIIFFTRQ